MIELVTGMGAAVGGSPFFDNYQWMMIFSLFFMLSYQETSKKACKLEQYFYYFGYPMHLLIMNMLSS